MIFRFNKDILYAKKITREEKKFDLKYLFGLRLEKNYYYIILYNIFKKIKLIILQDKFMKILMRLSYFFLKKHENLKSLKEF